MIVALPIKGTRTSFLLQSGCFDIRSCKVLTFVSKCSVHHGYVYIQMMWTVAASIVNNARTNIDI